MQQEGFDIEVYEHPLNSYQNYVEKILKTDFKPLTLLYGEKTGKTFKKEARKIRPNAFMRV